MWRAIWKYLRDIFLARGVIVAVEIEKTGEEKFKMKPGGFKPKWIILHHSLSEDNQVRNWDAIRKYHMSYRYRGVIVTEDQYQMLVNANETGLEKPSRDVGYHFGIENVNGKLEVLPGRQIGEVGAHAFGFNDKSVGICLVGNYDTESPSNDRLFILANLCRQLQLEYSIPRDQVIGHRETYALLTPPQPAIKTCPGSKFDLEKFRERLRD